MKKKKNGSTRLFRLFFPLLLLSGCALQQAQKNSCALSSIHITDRNGFSETVSSPDRLKQYLGVNFLSPQPYQKVLRVYNRDKKGSITSYITSYHPNGQPKQYLEVVNSRAFGKYQEWYPNGKQKLDANVIGGAADINTAAEASWLFDGTNQAWDEDGHLLANIFYEKGFLEGVSTYFHPNGSVWKKVPYEKNEIEGAVEIFLEDGQLLQKTKYTKGKKQGSSVRFWPNQKVSSKEYYLSDLLETGQYYDSQGNLVAKILQGTGFRAIFGKDKLKELHEYHQGIQEGVVKVFGEQEILQQTYSIKNGLKHGTETTYYTPSPLSTAFSLAQQPKLSIDWVEGKIQGVVKTWYKNGALESQKEMSHNTKNGLFTAWFRDGSLMMIEEYDQNKLVKGEYFRKGEKTPTSRVVNGEGVATFFDPEGCFVKRVSYKQENPVE